MVKETQANLGFEKQVSVYFPTSRKRFPFLTISCWTKPKMKKKKLRWKPEKATVDTGRVVQKEQNI